MIAVEIRNFQSIERATFQVDGFTSLVGRSNIGKSALIRAIKCALTGAPVSTFIRHGAACARKVKNQKTCKCYISVRLRSDAPIQFDLLWEKGDSINRYVYDGVDFPAAERGMPDFLLPLFNEIEVGGKGVLLQVADQFTPIFLLDQSGIAVADVLSDMAKLDQVNVAIRMVEKDRKGANATRGIREKDLVEARSKLAGFDGLEATLQDVRALQRRNVEILERRATVTRLATFGRTFGSLQLQENLLGGIAGLPLPALEALHQARSRHTALQGMIGRARDQKIALEALRGLEGVAVPSLAKVKAQEEASQRFTGWVNALHNFRTILGRFQAVPLPSLPVLPSPQKHQRIAGLLDRWESLTRTLSSLELDHKRADDEEKTVRSEWELLGVCSMCARPFHTDTHPSRV